MSALITRSSGSSEAGSASRPIVTSETAGNRPLGCSRANAGRKSPSSAAAYGTRDAPSSRPYVEANAVIRTASVTAIANGAPNARSATSEAIALEAMISFGATAAATPRFKSTYAAPTNSTESTTARGIVRAGASTSSPSAQMSP
ncbi:MAG TPA: hypothetical protein VHS78_02675 [Candidatus Elarobacter sp.]|nr:hypothetical protein [Candidatus Elarobacter sp.]